MFHRDGEPHTFEKKHGSYYWYDSGGRISYMADEVTVAFSISPTGVLAHKHGSPEVVESWMAHVRAEFGGSGNEDLATEFWTVTSNRWDPKDLTRFFSTTGYFEHFAKKHKLIERAKKL